MIQFSRQSSMISRLVAGSLAGLLVAAIPLLLSGYALFKERMLVQTGQAAQNQSAHVARVVDRLLAEHLKQVTYTAQMQSLEGPLDRQRLRNMIQVMRGNAPGYLWIGVANPEGEVLAALDDLLVGKSVAQRPWFKQGLQGPGVMDVHEAKLLAALLPERDGEIYQFIDFTTPLKNMQGETVGVLGVHLDWRAFLDEVRLAVDTPNELVTLVLSSSGQIRFGNQPGLSALHAKTQWNALSGFREALAGLEGGWHEISLADGEPQLLAFSGIGGGQATENLHWVAATIMPLRDVQGVVDKATAFALLALLGGSLFTVALVAMMARRLSLQARGLLNLLKNGQLDGARLAMKDLPQEFASYSEDMLQLTEHLTLKNQQLEQALNHADQERDANQSKSRFLATMSHEIRTPLNGVLGFAKLLHMDLPDGEQKTHAQHLVQTAETLTVIVNDILDYSRIETGMVKLSPAPVCLSDWLRASTELSRLLCATKQLDCQVDCSLSAQHWHETDAGRLRQILQNLLSNAIKFTQHGEVRVTLDCVRQEGERDWIRLTVRDTGPGMSAEQLSRLFKPYIQVHNDPDNHFGGTGLGLSIVQGLASAMGGSVAVRSTVGAGTVFTVDLPLKRTEAPRRVETGVPKASRPLQILVADDTPLNLRVLQAFLNKAGHQVYTACDGPSALEAAQDKAYDWILLDIDMPRLSGYEVARQLREGDGPNQHTPMAALTGYAFEDDVRRALDSGFDFHFAKPLDFDALLDQLAQAPRKAGNTVE